MAKQQDPAPPGLPPAPPTAPRKLALQLGPTPTPPGSRLKPSRK